MARIILKTIFKLKRAKAATWASKNPVLEDGEPGFVLDQNKLKIGDGIHAWNVLPYIDGSSSAIQVQGDGKSVKVTVDGQMHTLSVLGLDTAATGTVPSKGADGVLQWVDIDGKMEAFTYSKEVIDQKISAIKTIEFRVVAQLPAVGESHIIYLVPKAGTSGNIYDEYIYVGNKWEKIGSTDIDLSNYYTKPQVNELLALKQNSLVKESTEKNSIYVDNSGKLTVNDIGVEKLSNTEGIDLILNGGIA